MTSNLAGTMDKPKMPDLTALQIEQIARMAHEVQRQWCRMLGDFSHGQWNEATESKRASAIARVEYAVEYKGPNWRESFRCYDPRDQHDRWMLLKLRDGWRYGPIKDVVNKIHPCLLPWDDLPPEQRIKDIFFVEVVRAMRRRFEEGMVLLKRDVIAEMRR